ncbi:7,8-dihydroneopterin aldolase [Halolactibacillus alkaliphilus]|uniref:7,8-dihydroneopterin aldolase n=1 Tax=Halolactibacillus alkaliphilus TaxID=442899 RepID=A0A511X4S0_9BACI|nr:dihydroneopterin aldolase [Halolactibacillus alkaliphilus]GEN57949.1 7,8-dihydroneopterin aldolase [Halolactibacillus alkaliphilus]GGN75914.1 7,8-dihydroneopterin aldolase [Halolactibacillus alkaliphilus]SFP09313.1 dihydroneopterin aldolase [Halolactibacillus alkaliphilus]
MDKIFLNGLSFYAYHGALKEENILGQVFKVDLVLELDLAKAGENDDLSQTVHYGHVYETVKYIVEGEPLKLIEAVAEKVSEAVLKQFPQIKQLTVKLTKPTPPIPGHYDSVAVEIVRGRNND